MEKDSAEQSAASKSIGPVAIEWNLDFDDLACEMESVTRGDRKYAMGEKGRFGLKGICKRCWGGLVGKCGSDHIPNAIRCRVCGTELEGDAARQEYERMTERRDRSMFEMTLGVAWKAGDDDTYRDDGKFVLKVFPHFDRESAEEFDRRTGAEAQKGSRKRCLTRSQFRGGSAGYLFLQA